MTIALGIAAFFTTKSMSAPSLTPIQLANIEALTNTEGGYSIPCYSSASRDYNKAYVDFSSCTRIEGWKGTGTEAVCNTM